MQGGRAGRSSSSGIRGVAGLRRSGGFQSAAPAGRQRTTPSLLVEWNSGAGGGEGRVVLSHVGGRMVFFLLVFGQGRREL